MFKKFFCAALLFASSSSLVQATIVVFETSHGDIQVNLFDQSTPKTVANFLKYVDEQHYTNSIIHRAVPNFVVQGGGYNFEGEWPLTRKTTNPAVINEPVYSNVKGTIAMAKLGNNPNSATDQWFFNLVDSSAGNPKLDTTNGGFTVFGQVIGDGMTVLEKIAKLTLCNANGLQDIPMVADTTQTCADLATPGLENFVVLKQITIIDSSAVTDANLTPVKNTLLNKAPTQTVSDSSGGTIVYLSLFSLLLLLVRRRVINH